MATSNLVGVLVVMKIDPSISATPFANIRNSSYYQGEEEIIFSMHSVFRIVQVQQTDKNDCLWQLDLTLTGDNDRQLHALTERIREEMRGSTEWFRLGQIMISLGQFNKAEDLYEILLKQSTNDGEKAHLFSQLGWAKTGQGNYPEAIESYEKALEMQQKTLPAHHPDLATSYNNMGGVYNNMGEHSKALPYFEQALEIRQKTLPKNHPMLATSYNNIGEMYRNMGEYSKALSYHEKALEIFQKTLSADHPSLATSYSNIGLVYYHMGEYSKALAYYQHALDIRLCSLPSNHPDLRAVRQDIEIVKKKV
jgi:tetratricopeptide (TPR) repeat protein